MRSKPPVGKAITQNTSKTMTQSPFELPKELREIAEKNVAQAEAAYKQFTDAMTQAMGMWTKSLPANEMTNGFRAIQERAAAFAKKNAEAGFGLAADIAKAKDVQEVLALQTRFAQSQMQTYAQQTQELGRAVGEAMQTSMKPKG
jgi:hypothetical protein